MAADNISPVGLAMPLPAMSGAEPWIASNKAVSLPMFELAAKPRPPTKPAISSDKMSPNMLVVTMTSNWLGFSISCMAQLSTMRSSISKRSRYFSPISIVVSRNRPVRAFSMLALCTIVTLRRLCSIA